MKNLKKTISLLLFLLLLMTEILPAFAAGLITYGKENEEILEMQKRLVELGFFTHEANGYFGDETVTAIENFQTANGLTPTGLADPETIEKMKSEDAVDKKAYIDAVRALETLEYTFRVGDRSKLVKRLQSLLFEKGYLETSVT